MSSSGSPSNGKMTTSALLQGAAEIEMKEKFLLKSDTSPVTREQKDTVAPTRATASISQPSRSTNKSTLDEKPTMSPFSNDRGNAQTTATTTQGTSETVQQDNRNFVLPPELESTVSTLTNMSFLDQNLSHQLPSLSRQSSAAAMLGLSLQVPEQAMPAAAGWPGWQDGMPPYPVIPPPPLLYSISSLNGTQLMSLPTIMSPYVHVDNAAHQRAAYSLTPPNSTASFHPNMFSTEVSHQHTYVPQGIHRSSFGPGPAPVPTMQPLVDSKTIHQQTTTPALLQDQQVSHKVVSAGSKEHTREDDKVSPKNKASNKQEQDPSEKDGPVAKRLRRSTVHATTSKPPPITKKPRGKVLPPRPPQQARTAANPRVLATVSNVESVPNKTAQSIFRPNGKEVMIFGLQTAALETSKQKCTCPNTQCLKLYCVCFSQGLFCNEKLCSCNKCRNVVKYAGPEGTRTKAANAIMASKPHAFGLRIKNKDGPCECKKNRCLKKYCRCFARKSKCGDECICKGCLNQEESSSSPQQQQHQPVATPQQQQQPVTMTGEDKQRAFFALSAVRQSEEV